MANTDPFYNRKPVPDDFIEHVGFTGLTSQEETVSRERKYSKDGGDVRRFWNPKNKDGKLDPHYARRQVPDSMIRGVGETGLTPEEEFMNRERKYSVNGVDVRKFSNSATGGMEPQNDPYYGRKPVAKPEINNVGDSGYSKAEEYEIRERKQSMFQESTDPFQQLSGSGHRQSISAGPSGAAAAARRRSSAVAPDFQHHSGYNGDDKLEPIQSRNEPPPPASSNFSPNYTTTTTTTTTTGPTTTVTTGSGGVLGGQSGHGEHGLYHDDVTADVAPHELR